MPLNPLHLTLALRVLGTTALKVSTHLTPPQARNLSWYLAGRTPLETETLAALAELFPKLNTRYVLTGEGDLLI